MFCWHKWGRWSKPIDSPWMRQTFYKGYPVGAPQEVTRFYQERTCEKCGKYQKRYIKEG